MSLLRTPSKALRRCPLKTTEFSQRTCTFQDWADLHLLPGSCSARPGRRSILVLRPLGLLWLRAGVVCPGDAEETWALPSEFQIPGYSTRSQAWSWGRRGCRTVDSLSLAVPHDGGELEARVSPPTALCDPGLGLEAEVPLANDRRQMEKDAHLQGEIIKEITVKLQSILISSNGPCRGGTLIGHELKCFESNLRIQLRNTHSLPPGNFSSRCPKEIGTDVKRRFMSKMFLMTVLITGKNRNYSTTG